jgi:hypothetical protein
MTCDQPAIAGSWLVRRMFPVLATAGLLIVGMASTIWWGPALVGKTGWSLPHDLWGTMIAAQRLARGDLAGLYTSPTGLVSLPGAAVIMVPVVLVAQAAGLSLRVPGPHHAHPGAWLLAGPYAIVLAATALFAADALAEHLGVSRPRRALLAGAGAVGVWSVSARWGHPEDAVAVALLLSGVLALARNRAGRAAWLTGAAIAVQPLVVLAVPVLLAVLPVRRWPGFAARAAAPGAVLLAAAAAANWSATTRAVLRQPNWPAVDHPTPWTPLAPALAHHAVAAGPVRWLAVLAACGCGLAVRRARGAPDRPADGAPDRTSWWTAEELRGLLWWLAVALALRSVFEPVMVAYYPWPALALALIAATGSWRRLITTSVAAAAVTGLAQGQWRGLWTWWAPVIALLALTLALARPAGRPRPARGPGPGERPREMMITR